MVSLTIHADMSESTWRITALVTKLFVLNKRQIGALFVPLESLLGLHEYCGYGSRSGASPHAFDGWCSLRQCWHRGTTLALPAKVSLYNVKSTWPHSRDLDKAAFRR